MDDIKKELIGIIAREGNISEELIVDEAKFKEDLAMNSLAFIKIVTVIEQNYNVTFDDEDLGMDEDISIGDFCDKVFELMDN